MLQSNLDLLDLRKEFFLILDDIFELQMKQKETNEVSRFLCIFCISNIVQTVNMDVLLRNGVLGNGVKGLADYVLFERGP